jgi:hypothetical protein
MCYTTQFFIFQTINILSFSIKKIFLRFFYMILELSLSKFQSEALTIDLTPN